MTPNAPHVARRPRRRRMRAASPGVGLVALLVSACAVAPPPDPDPLFEAPFRLDYGARPTVEARIDGEGPFDLIIDTASSISAVFRNLTDRLETPVDETDLSQVFSLNGTVRAPAARLRRVDLGGASATDVTVVVFEDWDPPTPTPQGLIGLDILEGRVAEFDVASGRFRLYAADAAPDYAARGWGRAALAKSDFGVPGLALRTLRGGIDLRVFPVLVDTGADSSIGNFPLLLALVPRWQLSVIVRRDAELNDVADLRARAFTLRYESFSTGPLRWGAGELLISEASIFRELGYVDEPLFIAGFDLFGRRSFAVDFANDVLYAAPAQDDRATD